jgi:LysM repeat protein
MSPESTSKQTKICPTCGTRVSEDAARCLVCGTDLSAAIPAGKSAKAVQGSRMPEITLSLPAALGLLIIFLGVGALVVYFALGRTTGSATTEPTVTPTITETPTLTPTGTALPPTVTFTPEPTPTPITYVVKLGDNCGAIAFTFGVTIQSIVLLNNLPADCSTLFEGQTLLVPQPTPTPTAMPTATLNPAEATEAACEKVEYTVQESDTLGSISINYQVPAAAIREYNGLVNDIVIFGQQLTIPLCRRELIGGATPTPTTPPPYPAPNLLLPADGAPFSANDETVPLQWASVGTLRSNEAYAVTVEDVTEGQGRKLVEYVVDTKYIVPLSFRPTDGVPHVMRWLVIPVRQTGTDENGNPIWTPAGAPSTPRVFTWTGLAIQAIPATPIP